MTSEIPSELDGSFAPDEGIIRNDAIYALWERYGAVTVKEIPSFLKSKGDAAAWAYSYGIMTGDDGVDLRLDDTITRAEAAALIVRAENSKTNLGFASAIPDSTCKTVFDSTHAFSSAYSPDSGITYGEFARAVVLLCYSQVQPEYTNFIAKELYESDYARDMYVIGFYALGEDMINAEKEKAYVTREDAKKCLEKIVSVMRSSKPVNFSLCLYENTDWSKTITHKELASMLVQLDELIGLEDAYTVTGETGSGREISNVKIKKAGLPETFALYKSILADVPENIYSIDVSAAKTSPFENYYFAQTFSSLFLNQCQQIAATAKSEYASDIKITYYPTLCYGNENGFAMILKVENVSGTKTPEELFGDAVIPGTSNGNTFFVHIAQTSVQ